MTSPAEMLSDQIAEMLQDPGRSFVSNPLTQTEIHSVMEIIQHEVNDPRTHEEIAHFYLAVYEFLKPKAFYT